jgi:gamma-glutamyl:cysteine ligase YbdK (ATP-grasp superfamily)
MANKTISSIAKDLNISRARVYQIIDMLDDNEKPSKDSNDRYVIDDNVVNAIRKYYANSNTKAKQEKTSPIDDKVLDIMRHQLDEKDRQIEKLTQLLDQQQQLNLSTNRQNEKLLDTTTNNTPSQDDRPLQNDHADVSEPTEGNYKGGDTKTPKKGLFGWLRR